MSIASELITLAANKAAIKAAIEAKNPSIAPTDALAQWPTSIASISSGTPLPYDEIVDYLSFPAGAYIVFDSTHGGLVVSGPYDVNIALYLKLPSGMSSSSEFRAGNNSGATSTSLRFRGNGTALYACDFSSEKPVYIGESLNLFKKYFLSNGYWSFDEGRYFYSSALGPSRPSQQGTLGFCLGGWCTSSGVTAGSSSFDLSYLSLDVGDTHLSCIPVRVGQVGALYDTVSGTLYENSGSGTITPVKLTA